MLKSLDSAFTHLQNAPVKLRGRYKGELTIIFLVIFKDTASKLEKIGPIFSSFFNPFPSLPSAAIDGKKQFQCCNIY